MNTNKKLLVSAAAVIAIAIIGAVGYVLFVDRTNPGNASSSSPANNTPSKTTDNGTSITVTGKIICLPHKDTTGPVDAMCAIGLAGDDGKNYALGADDPTLTGGVPTEQKVKIVGSFTEQTSQYDSVGVIKVESLERQ